MTGDDCFHEGVGFGASDTNNMVMIKDGVMTEQAVYDVTEILKLLCDPTRAQIIWALSGQELCVCDISKLLNMSVSAISHQLRLLKQSRIVKSRREGRTIFYKLSDRRIMQILNIAFEHVTEEKKGNNEQR